MPQLGNVCHSLLFLLVSLSLQWIKQQQKNVASWNPSLLDLSPGSNVMRWNLFFHESQLLPGNLASPNLASYPEHSSLVNTQLSLSRQPQPFNENLHISLNNSSSSYPASQLGFSLAVSREYSLGSKTRQNPLEVSAFEVGHHPLQSLPRSLLLLVVFSQWSMTLLILSVSWVFFYMFQCIGIKASLEGEIL